MKTTCTWKNDFQSVVNNDRNHEVVLDLPFAKGGANQGATALELSLMSLSGCVVTIFSLVAKKMRLEFSQLQVEINAEQNPEDQVFTKCNAILKISSPENDQKISQCLEHTLKTCPVGLLFSMANVEMHVDIVRLT